MMSFDTHIAVKLSVSATMVLDNYKYKVRAYAEIGRKNYQ
jgi:hypothetical protein